MNEFYLDTAAGGNLVPRRLEQEAASKKNSKSLPSEKGSFQEVLKNMVDKTDGSAEVRQDLVNKYKVSLANGTYEVKAQELAEKIIQKIREGKTREII